MENEIQIFNSPTFGQIRTILDDKGVPWFVGKDVAEVLGYKNTSKTLTDHVKEDDKLYNATLSSLGQRGGWLINESGFYCLVMSSRLQQAQEFKQWVTSEVLPSIRKHGAYMTDQAIEQALLNPDTVIKLATSLKQEREARIALQAKNAEQLAMIAEKDAQIQDMSAKSTYCEHVLASEELVEITLIAQDYGTTATMMNRFLNDAGIQYRLGKTWALYEPYKYKGYTQSKTFPIRCKDGTVMSKVVAMWTQKGRLFLYEFLKKNYGALPIVERDENYVQPYGLMSSTAKKWYKRK